MTREIYFLSAPIEVNTGDRQINSDNLIDYLSQKPDFQSITPEQFAPVLDLGFLSEPVDALYRTHVRVGAMSKEERKILFSILNGTHQDTDIQRLVRLRELAERGTIFFTGLTEKGSYYAYSKIDVGWVDLIIYFNAIAVNLQNKGLILIHTHPMDSIFSPEDLIPLIEAAPGKGRFLTGALVLGPTKQFLGLATSETPVYDTDKINSYLGYWTSRLQDLLPRQSSEEDKSYILARRLAVIYMSQEAKLQVLNKKEVKNKKDQLNIDRQKKILMITRRTYDHIFGQSQRDPGLDIDQLCFEMNSLFLEAAQSLGVKLYSSTDRHHFKAFPA